MKAGSEESFPPFVGKRRVNLTLHFRRGDRVAPLLDAGIEGITNGSYEGHVTSNGKEVSFYYTAYLDHADLTWLRAKFPDVGIQYEPSEMAMLP